ncbi:LysR family transcriptional regulator [Naasia lichenicola]|uniref:LysR family transcriptional regulator n=1 Tax=Naasia lichenicola TaxID=2565933 RepID=A0A4V3WTE0_9MICO|nr:LysR family transcriptional regulator [Naasia lichenicola]THG31617.1 LysR family transcriptional regulator [Naasia lichenicola]
MDVPLSMLNYFCVLADELHYGNAARKLRISSPSLSQQISRLETLLGVVLFDRTPRKVELTAAGRELLPLARGTRQAHQAVIDWARSRRPDDELQLRVGVVAAGAGELTTSALTAAIHQMPQLRLEMRRLGFFEALPALRAGLIDVAFAPAPLPDAQGIRVATVAVEQRVLVMRADHPLAGRESISILETTGETFITPSSGDQVVMDWWVVDPRPDGSSPRRGPTADDIEGILELCAAGAGVNIAAESAAANYRRDGLAFVPISDVEPCRILLCSLETSANPAVRSFEAVAVHAMGG